MDTVINNTTQLFPLFLWSWIIFFFFTWLLPQKLFNCFLLMVSLIMSIFFIAGFFGNGMQTALFAIFLLITLLIFMVPILLITNGIYVMKKEGKSLSHMLSLLLGIFVGIGEVATVISVFSIGSENILAHLNKYIGLLATSVFYFSVIILVFVLYSIFIMFVPSVYNFDYIIIHGCGLANGERVTKLLGGRIDKAIKIYEKCGTKPFIVASGGQGSDEKLSEAEAIKKYLLEKGIPEERILKEERSTTTFENVVFSKALILEREIKNPRVALVSSNYHVYRCLCYAKRVKLRCRGFGSKTAIYYWPTALLREFAAVYKEKKKMIPAIGFWIILMWMQIQSTV